MNEDSADYEDGAKQREEFSRKEIGSQRKRESQQAGRAEVYSDDDVGRFVLDITSEWNKLEFFKRLRG